ncbi:non-ribosomal peptide synthetase [Photobacterium gaetbulicola]|uniref:Putative amino acid adenylation domain protein n=1 Tax=Photobacterium gaetbulicola Gung47 TaxID=658445 RepID=A0A0C5WK66_9GAMM|nr:non-ribosomal peptide synthetase [Photobacterium gaetbulicola]AJR06622.1 putative amino acid adenylation domain protein [Photobacterium gaetbulicola Gung47]PSU13946.1 non-ribosomal peptide synthetase [Photobacterium gaetbulicola]
MDINQLIQSLNQKGIFLYVLEGKLKARVTTELPEDLKTVISKHKEALISYLSAFKGSSTVLSIPTRDTSFPAPLSFSQQAIWVVNELQDNSVQYNMPVVVNLRGALNVDALQWALNEILRRHEVLRTGVIVHHGQPAQQIRPYKPKPLTMVDLSGLTAIDREREVERAVQRELTTPFDLRRDNLLRSTLLRLSDGEFILLQTMHHISSDGWSISLLTQELSTLYHRYISGNRKPLPELMIDYADYACWQRDELRGDSLGKLQNYWKKALAGAPEIHHFPLDRARPPEQTFRGAVVKSRLSERQTDALRELCRQQNATLFMGLHALLTVLISALSNDDDVMIGTPVANRDHHQLSNIIGLFINTLVLRGKVAPEMTFEQVLANSRATILGALEHQQLPFELLLESLDIGRSAGYSPLFQIMLVLQNNTQPVLELPGIEIEASQSSAITAKYDLTLYATEDEERLAFVWEYNTDLFDQETIQRLAETLENLLTGVAEQPRAPLSALHLISDSEQRALLDSQGIISSMGLEDNSLLSLFNKQVQHVPGATALVYHQKTLNFAELDRLSSSLANQLTQFGLASGARVGIHMARSFEMVVGILAVLKIGGIYVPLDPRYPEDRLQYMINDADIELVLTAADQQQTLEHRRKTVGVDLTALASETRLERYQTPASSLADSLIYIIYTSGSTGIPKGVKGTQRGLLNRLQWMWQQFPFSSGEVCSHKTSLNFVDHVWELFGPLLQGVPLVLVDEETARNPSELATELAAQRVTRLVVVPSLLQAILDLPEQKLLPLQSLVHWTSSGEELPAALVRRFYSRFENAVLLNLYGSSEVSADATWYDTREMPDEADSVPVGRPIANTRLYVMNANRQLLPRGMVGELYVGGVGVAAGYTNEQQTSERFVRPLAGEGVLFKTGDQVRWCDDGVLTYVGRNDHQIKIRGHRIELGEIESTLVGFSDIRHAVVIAREAQDLLNLAAYIVPEPLVEVDIDSLFALMAAKLPEYMIPASMTVLSELPLTPNGKLDRRALPAPENTNRDNYVAPRNELETKLCVIWQDALGVERIGIHDNYYRIGGNSIAAVKLVSSINRELGLNLKLRDLFELKTVAGLAERSSNGNGRRIVEISARAGNKKIKNVMEL